jgi:FlaA1/EpsC-like NDP-sugar epimerase
MKDQAGKAVAPLLRFRRLLSLVAQLLLVVLANRLAFGLRFDSNIPDWANQAFWGMLPWLILIRGITFIPFRLYEGLWRYTSISDLEALIGGIASSSVVFFILTRTPLGPPTYPRSIFIIDALILTVLLGGIRMMRRFYAEYSRVQPGRRVLIFGAGDAGELIVRDMKNNAEYGVQPIGFIDDDSSKLGRRIHNVPVLGTRNDLPLVVEQYRPDEVLIALPNADPVNIRSIVRSLEPFKLAIKTLPNLRDIIDGKIQVDHIRSLAVEDLLVRAPVGLDPRPVKSLIAGRRVMVTGAGGSIGSELCRQIAKLRPASLVMLDRYENSLHAIRLELEDRKGTFALHPVVGDVTDAQRVAAVLQDRQPEIVFHAAAHKHVPLMEENPCEAIKNNVRGTRLLVQAAEAAGVDRFIMISTDKAVNPTSVMGASKRVAEMIVRAQADGSGTSFSIVRFGNVLGSNGSVVPRFMEQIKRGGPVTITHPDMKRFFMLIPEAVQLVLHAAAQAESGATYVLEMGEQVNLTDMARDLIRLSGLVPDEDIKIEFMGLRPGEKLYEELVGADEDAAPSPVEEILCVRSRQRPAGNLASRIEALEADAAAGRVGVVLAALRDLTGMVAPDVRRPASEAAETAALAASIRAVHGVRSCPICETGMIHRSHAKSMVERVKREFSSRRLYRCDACGWRGWLMPLQFAAGTSPIEAQPALDLRTLDAVVPPVEQTRRPSFSPRNLR